MKRHLISLTLVLALPTGGALLPTAAVAQHGAVPGRSYHAGNVMVRGSIGVHRFARPVPVPRPPFRRPGFRAFPPVAIGSPVVVFAPPPIYYGPSSAGGPAGEPASSVVQYPGGHYELRGDGVTLPYSWVWIPDPPSGPPDAGTRTDRGEDVNVSHPSPPEEAPEPKILSIPDRGVYNASSDPTAPKVISIPPPEASRSGRR
jgi:hypothetical protein